MKDIITWVENASKYPPAEIFFQTKGKDKAEKRVVGLCEELYRLTYPDGQVNILASLRTAHRELEVLHNISWIGKIKVDEETKIRVEFLKAAKAAVNAMNQMFKKDSLLNEYYKGWSMTYEQIEKSIKEG